MGIMFSLLLTFIICGFWHGANLTFIIWGALFGAAMSYEVLTAKIRKKLKKKINARVYTFISWFFTFHFVTFLWIFFRAKNMQAVGKMFSQIFANMDWTYLSPFISARKLLVEILLLGFTFYALPAKWYPNITQRFIKLPYWVKLIIFIAIIQLVIQFQSEDVQPFIYAQF
jgi:D-alanyl-lipoteichoic acid acyltransferase DltB (MBOAT superfamily)